MSDLRLRLTAVLVEDEDDDGGPAMIVDDDEEATAAMANEVEAEAVVDEDASDVDGSDGGRVDRGADTRWPLDER